MRFPESNTPYFVATDLCQILSNQGGIHLRVLMGVGECHFSDHTDLIQLMGRIAGQPLGVLPQTAADYHGGA